MNLGKISTSLAASALLASIFISAAQAQQLPMLYRVKFVCGQPVGGALAPGRYFTVINVHNPIEDASTKPISFRMKFAVSPPQQGHTGFGSSFGRGRSVPHLYSKLQANAELRKMLNIGRSDERSDVSRLSDAELIQQLADTAKELGMEINVNYSFAQHSGVIEPEDE